MATNISLDAIIRGKRYLVKGFARYESPYAEKLYKMGFVEGTPIQLAPVELNDPIIVEIRGSRVALRKSEAQQVYVEEI